MKVLYILHSIIQGGATISFIHMIEGLKKYGVEPIIVHPKGDNLIFEEFIKRNNIKEYVIDLDMSIYWMPKRLKSTIGLIRVMYRKWERECQETYVLLEILKKEKPDIVHTNTGVIHTGFYAARRCNIPHVWHLREYQDKDFGWKIFPTKSIFQKMLKQSNVISVTQDILHHFHLAKSSTVKCIYNGCLSEKTVNYNWPKQNYFLCTNQIIRSKGMDDVIDGFAQFYKTHIDYKLIICGFGDQAYIEHLKSIAESKGCASAIEWRGFVHDTPALMEEAKALIVASLSEGFGRMSAEACLKGCIVIGRNTAGTKEILDKTGGCKFNTLQEMVEQMVHISDMCEDEYAAIALAAQKVALQLYTTESNFTQVFEFYNQVLSNIKEACQN